MHIPKTGGMSVEKSLNKVGVLHLKSPKLHGSKQLGFPCSPQHFHMDILNSMFKTQRFFDYQFAIVRNPVKRIVSEFKFRNAGKKLTEKELNNLFPVWLSKTFSRYHSDPFVLDNHIRPQNEFVSNDVEVFYFEKGIDTILQTVSQRLSLTSPLQSTHVNKSHSVEVEVSDESEAMIRDFYAEDFSRFGY